jgi:hypothetical protein
VNVCVESFLDPVFSAEIHPKSEEAKGISMIFEELLRKRQKKKKMNNTSTKRLSNTT